MDVDPYVCRTKAQIIQEEKDELQRVFDEAYSKWKKNPRDYEAKCRNSKHIEYLRTIPDRMKRTDEELYQDAIGGLEKRLTKDGDLLSTRNPYSKWDWCEIGGRWKDSLILMTNKDDSCKEVKKPKRCNAAFVSDIDFEAMQNNKAAGLRPYEEALKNTYSRTKDEMLEMYPNKAEYLKLATIFHTYAVVKPDGKWHEIGKMGWWGISFATPKEERKWVLDYHERFIKPALKNGWYVTIVDCHI